MPKRGDLLIDLLPYRLIKNGLKKIIGFAKARFEFLFVLSHIVSWKPAAIEQSSERAYRERAAAETEEVDFVVGAFVQLTQYFVHLSEVRLKSIANG